MLLGALSLLGVYLLVLGLHVLLPGRWVEGYARDAAGGRLRYRRNGLVVLLVILGAYAALWKVGALPAGFFYQHRFSMLATAFVTGLVFTVAVVLPAPSTGRGWLAELYLGRVENPQWFRGRIDAKMLLYLIGAVMLELLLVSGAAHHYLTRPDDASPGVALYAALFSFFLVDYLFFEEVHLYTYDFVAERVGFKLGWGCLVFYPFFYGIGLWFAADQPNPRSSPLWLALCAVLFFFGWALARGANLLSDVAGTPLQVVPRQLDDDRRCAEKYGALWDEYRRAVPYRIVPFIY